LRKNQSFHALFLVTKIEWPREGFENCERILREFPLVSALNEKSREGEIDFIVHVELLAQQFAIVQTVDVLKQANL
jgi:hypothetical protein